MLKRVALVLALLSAGALPVLAQTVSPGGSPITSFARNTTYADYSSSTLGASATAYGPIHPATVNFSKFNMVAFTQSAATLQIWSCQDAACANYAVVYSFSAAAGSTTLQTVAIFSLYYRIVVINGATATSLTINDSFTAS